MKLENQVCSLELGRKLWDLGLWNNTFEYCQRDGQCVIRFRCLVDTDDFKLTYPAFTVAELGTMLADEVVNIRPAALGGWMGFGNDLMTGLHKTEADCRAEYLFLMIDRNRITIEECNKRLLNN